MSKSEYPSLPEMGSNLAKFAFELLQKSMKGDVLWVSDEIANERLNICKGCEYYDPNQNRCLHCGCFLEHKVKWSLDSCPINKWACSDDAWMNGKFEEVYNHVKLGTDPQITFNHNYTSEKPNFPNENTTPIGFVHVENDMMWKFTGNSWEVYQE